MGRPERRTVSDNRTTEDLSPTVFVLYGATGDLARRMVLPAFFELAQHGLLPEDWRLIGSGRGERTDQEFVGHVRGALEEFGPNSSSEPRTCSTNSSSVRSPRPLPMSRQSSGSSPF